MDLIRTNIQTLIDEAHIKIDVLTDSYADLEIAGKDTTNQSLIIWQSLQIITILLEDTLLTAKEIEFYMERLIRLLDIREGQFSPTTLQIVQQQPAIIEENTLVVSGTAGVVPVYDSLGTSFEDSILSINGTTFTLNGLTFYMGGDATTGTSRSLTARGASSNIGLSIESKGTGNISLSAASGSIQALSPVNLTSTIAFTSGPSISEFTDDTTLASASAIALPTENAVKTYVDGEVTTLNAAIATATQTASNGLTKFTQDIQLGGLLTKSTIIDLGASNVLTFDSTGDAVNFILDAAGTWTLFGATGGFIDTGAAFNITGTALNYDVDRSGVYTDRSVTDKEYSDSKLGGQTVSSVVKNPTVSEDGYSVTWDNTGNQFVLSAVSGGGGGGDADTLDGIDSTQFLRSDVEDVALRKIDITLTAQSGATGKQMSIMTVSSDNTDARLSVSRDGVSDPDGFQFWNTDTAAEAVLKGLQFQSSVTTGTAPLTIASTTVVPNLNADQVDGNDASESNVASTIPVRDVAGNIASTSITVTSTGIVNFLNADQVDGFDADAANTPGTIVVRGVGDLAFVSGLAIGAHSFTNTTASNLATWTNGSGYVRLGVNASSEARLETDGTSFVFNQADIYANASKIWHEGNDGTGSGLDADLLKGATSSASSTAFTLALRDGSSELNAAAFNIISDRRKKKDIKNLSVQKMKKLLKVEPKEYVLLSNNKINYGVIADELEKLYPDLVKTGEDGVQSVDYVGLIGPIIAVLQRIITKNNLTI